MRLAAAATVVLVSISPALRLVGRSELQSATPGGVTRVTITSRTPAFGGRSFGAVGPYEEIKGILVGEIDPVDRRNAVITDIDRAPRNVRGLADYRTTFTILKPVDMAKSPGVAPSTSSIGAATWPNTCTSAAIRRCVSLQPGQRRVERMAGDLPISAVSPAQEASTCRSRAVSRDRFGPGSPASRPTRTRNAAGCRGANAGEFEPATAHLIP